MQWKGYTILQAMQNFFEIFIICAPNSIRGRSDVQPIPMKMIYIYIWVYNHVQETWFNTESQKICYDAFQIKGLIPIHRNYNVLMFFCCCFFCFILSKYFFQSWNVRLCVRLCGAKIIFGGKLRNPYFCHIFGMERHFFFFKGMYQPGLGFLFGLTEN